MKNNSAIYTGVVVHKRIRPKKHKLSYNVYTLLLDLSELEHLGRSLRLFAYNKWAMMAFYDKDHGQKKDTRLVAWVKSELRKADISSEGVKVSLLCYPRVLGYVFNPISIYFCYDKHDALIAVFYEVSNTFHETHTYLFQVDGAEKSIIRQNCRKRLYVSPFNDMDNQYHFKLTPPGKRFNITIQQSDGEGVFLTATFQGQRKLMTDRNLLICFVSIPLMTLKVIVGIHWEALLLWFKGLRLVKHRYRTHTIEVSSYKSDHKED